MGNRSRRQFLKDSATLGGGLILGFHCPAFAASDESGGSAEINVWVVIDPDDTVTIRYARSEMGQGSKTSAAQLVAEELGADWSRVRVEFASTNEHVRRNKAWGPMRTVGSLTIRSSQHYLRSGGAAAREMLIAAAADRWGVAAGECSAADNRITHQPSGRTLSFGDVAQAATRFDPPEEPPLKEPSQWTLAGRSVQRLDIPDTVLGRQRFGSDAQLPGMVYASIAQCPVFGGRLKSMDASEVSKRRGVLKVMTVDDDTAVVVVADNWWRANEALKKLPLDWDFAGNDDVDSADIRAFLEAGFEADDLPVARLAGDADDALGKASKRLGADYFTPFQAHATMEPQTCTVLIEDGRVDVWTSTQNAEATHMTAAEVAGVPPGQVYVHRAQAGGGFGRRSNQDFTRQAVQVAKAMPGTPVKLQWSREEDTRHDYYRPVSLIRMEGGLDESGKLNAFTARIAAPSLFGTLLGMPLEDGIDRPAVAGFKELPFSIPHVRVEYARRDIHVPVGFWRTVGHSQNPFARECFIDELANAAGRDPLEFRRELLRDAPKDLGILEATAKKAGWGRKLSDGVHQGLAETEAYGSYTACVAEVSVSAKKELRLHRLVVGLDCGHMVNPDNIVAQIQGSVVYALSALLWGKITIDQGRVQQSNFHDFRLMKLSEMPKVETVLAPTGDFWGGVGEPPVAPIAPAVCNAIFAATGERVRSHPLADLGYSLATSA